METRINAKLFLFALLLITPVFHLGSVLDIALVPRFICWSVTLLFGICLLVKAEPASKYLTVLDIAFLTYYFITGLSLLWALNSANAIFEIQKVFAVLLTYLLIRFLLLQTEGRLIDFLLLCNLTVTVLTLMLVFWQIMTHEHFDRLIFKGFNKIPGFSAQRNLLCSFLYLTLIFNVLAVIYHKSKKWRLAYLFLIGVQLFVLLLFQARAVYIAIFISGICFLTGFQFIIKYFNLKRAAVFLGILFLLAGSVLTRLMLVDDDFKVYLEKIDVSQYTKSNSAQERIMMWNRTVQMIREQPLTGVGAGNWATFYPNEDTDIIITSKKYVFFQRPHNDFLWVFSETGLLGFLAYLSLFALTLFAGLQSIKNSKDSDKKLKIWTLLCGLIGYIVIANFSFPKERIEHQIWFALLLAVLAYYLSDYFRSKPKLSLARIDNRILILFLAAGLCFNLVIGYYRYQGERVMRQIYTSSLSPSQKQQLIPQGQSYFYNSDAVGFPLSWHLGLAANQLSQPQEALEHFIAAYTLNPNNFRIANDLAAAYSTVGNREKAIQYFETAHLLDPKGEATIYNLTILNYQLRNYTIAISWAEKLPEAYPRRYELLEELREK